MYISKLRLLEIALFLLVALFAILAFYARQEKGMENKPLPQQTVTMRQFPSYTVPVVPNAPIQVGFVGETRGDSTKGEVINHDLIPALLKTLKDQKVETVFFTGNLISAEIFKPHANSEDNGNSIEFLPVTLEMFTNQLKEFEDLVNANLGNVPFFPVPGDHEIRIKGGEVPFKALLIEDRIETPFIGYTVGAGDAFFAVIQTDWLDPNSGKVRRGFPSQLSNWLQGILKEASSRFKYLFVVGHEPAYPNTSTLYKEPEKDLQDRNLFWKVLVDNGVIAYFCSHEHIFDRSNRFGVWQVISGGGGSPNNTEETNQPFFHSLILEIPKNKEKPPTVKVYDRWGQQVSEFKLLQESSPLYQQHISFLKTN